MANTLKKAKAYKHCLPLRDMEAEALIERLADMLEEAKAATFSDTLSDVEDEALIDTLADMYRWRMPTQLTPHWLMCKHKHSSSRWPTPYKRLRNRHIATKKTKLVNIEMEGFVKMVASTQA